MISSNYYLSVVFLNIFKKIQIDYLPQVLEKANLETYTEEKLQEYDRKNGALDKNVVQNSACCVVS